MASDVAASVFLGSAVRRSLRAGRHGSSSLAPHLWLQRIFCEADSNIGSQIPDAKQKAGK